VTGRESLLLVTAHGQSQHNGVSDRSFGRAPLGLSRGQRQTVDHFLFTSLFIIEMVDSCGATARRHSSFIPPSTAFDYVSCCGLKVEFLCGSLWFNSIGLRATVELEPYRRITQVQVAVARAYIRLLPMNLSVSSLWRHLLILRQPPQDSNKRYEFLFLEESFHGSRTIRTGIRIGVVGPS